MCTCHKHVFLARAPNLPVISDDLNTADFRPKFIKVTSAAFFAVQVTGLAIRCWGSDGHNFWRMDHNVDWLNVYVVKIDLLRKKMVLVCFHLLGKTFNPLKLNLHLT